MNAPNLVDFVAPGTLADVERHAAAFAKREPFRHVVIDDFLAPDYAAALLAAFPPFERGNARNEAGDLGGKSTIERIRGLGAPYAALDDLIQSREFLDLVGRITGIPDLLYDPDYFGGGTHESRQGQDLDAHVDFNRHPSEGWHRRLNLIVYFNDAWNDAWGGSLELHSDPRSPDDRVTVITPLYNRCVIFETTEWSWHAFPPIALPAEQRSRTRKSIALYFYTRDRPSEELADTHSTIYVDRPLPERFRAGLTLGEHDVEELRVLLARRDQHNQRLYRDLQEMTRQLQTANAALRTGVIGRLGYLLRRVAARLKR
ncbi:2OG-Fe(II) oxygenase [Dokdonella sp.]|uniref:2OG-Fe(II) oxygenase n=1 Tax=Dokdonella sp. TaxID=2291710 RepID=UPI0037848E0E